MSAGVSALSDAELMRQLGPALGGAPIASAAPVTSGVSSLSDDELMRQLGQAGGRRANPFNPPGAPAAATFDDRFGNGPTAANLDTSTPLGAGLRRVADEELIGKPSAANAAAASVLRAGNAIGLNAPRNVAAGIATAAGALGVPGYGDRSFSENYALAKDQEEALARQNPKSAMAGTAVGIGAGALALPATPLIGGTGMAARIGQGAATGFLYGGAGEFADSKDLSQSAFAAGVGAGVGGAAVPAITYAAKGAQALLPWLNKGVTFTNSRGEYTPEAKAALSRAGVHPDLLPPRQAEKALQGLDASAADVFATKGVSDATAREAVAGEFGIPLSRGQATGDRAVQRFEASAGAGNRGTRAQTAADEFQTRQTDATNAALQRFNDQVGRGVTLDNPQQAAEVIADQAREFSRRAALDAQASDEAASAALARVRGAAPVDQVDAGGAVAQSLRDAAGASKGRYRAAYDEVSQTPGEFMPGALDRIGTTVRKNLGPDLPIDDVLTPAATRALRDLDNLPDLFRTKPGAGPTMQQVELVRRRLGALYPSTAQNPTDRAVLNAIRTEFDDHVSNAAEAGLFGPRQAARAVPDGFPGAPALDALPGNSSAAGGAPEQAESLLKFLGRNGGIALDGDARAADYGRIQTGFGPLGRKNGRPIEDFRDVLASEGFIRPDDSAGAISRKIGDELHDLIGIERGGNPVYRLADVGRGAAPIDRTGRVAAESAAFAERTDNLSRQIVDELEAVGIRGRDVDPDALRDASEMLARGRHTDPTEAYEAALMAREPAVRSSSPVEDVPFDGPTALATSDALPNAVPDVVDQMRKARALFSEYKKTFSPQGAGDDVGLAMRRIVDRNAEPVEVSRMLYAGNPGLNIRLAERIKQVVGAESPAWAAHQQGYLSSILNGANMGPEAVSARITAALEGQKRGLTTRILTEQQIAGLREFQAAAANSRLRHEAVPEWITALGRSDFDPNRIMADLFGSGVPGARPGSAAYGGALKRFVGEDSAEWSGLRLAAWQKLTMSPDGTTMMPARDISKRIAEFASGKGAGLAKEMFEPELLAEMKRFGNALRFTVKSDGTPLPDNGGMMGKVAGRAFDAIAAYIGFKIGGPGGAAAAYTARLGSKGIQNTFTARAARRSFEGGAPAVAPEQPPLDLSRLGVGAGGVAVYGVGQ